MFITRRDNEEFFDLLSAFTIDDLKTCLPEVLAHIKENFQPEDVFDEKQLEAWASENGYITES